VLGTRLTNPSLHPIAGRQRRNPVGYLFTGDVTHIRGHRLATALPRGTQAGTAGSAATAASIAASSSARSSIVPDR
jgi:hypothetical protein